MDTEEVFDVLGYSRLAQDYGLTLLDASIGLAQSHLGGPPCEPPVNRILASYDLCGVLR